MSARLTGFLDSVVAALNAGLDPVHQLMMIPANILTYIAHYYDVVDETFPNRNQRGVRSQARGTIMSLWRPVESMFVRLQRTDRLPITAENVLEVVAALRPLAELRPAP